MVKKDEKDHKGQQERVLATGASGDPNRPELGAPLGAETYFEAEPVTETVTQAKTTTKKESE